MTASENVLTIFLALLCVSWVIGVARVVLGPSLADRVVALDILTAVAIGILSVYAALTHQPVFLDVALILGLVTFLGTVAFAYYLEKKGPE